jgi:hypothetical protein
MDAPISFRPGIAPPWPFTVSEFSATVTASSGPSWEGNWQTPPPEVCDILTAAEWRIQFQFDPSELSGVISSSTGLSAVNSDPVTLDTTIKPGQIKRRTFPNGDEYEVGGGGYQSVEEIFTGNFLTSDEYPSLIDTLTGNLLKLSYFWSSPYVEDGDTLFGFFNEVYLEIKLHYPVIGKDENDDWAWLFHTFGGSQGGESVGLFGSLATYQAAIVDRALNPSGFPASGDMIASGDVINFMGNQHAAPVAGFPVVSLSIVSHFGDV